MTGRVLAGRLLHAAVVFLAVFVVTFLLLHALPGDPLDGLDTARLSPEDRERNRRALGLDDPLPSQLARALSSYARGDLGVSLALRRPVAEVLGAALPWTALLGAGAILLAYGLGVPSALAILRCPSRSRSALKRIVLAFAVVPRFFVGVLLILLLHDTIPLFPASHAADPGEGGLRQILHHLILPVLTLGVPAAAVVARFLIAALEEAMKSPAVRTARASGSSEWRLLAGPALRMAAGPAIQMFGLDLPILVSGAVVVESVFSWPGAGRVTAEAILGSDYPLALASAALVALAVIFGRLAVEVLGRAADPRLSTSGVPS